VKRDLVTLFTAEPVQLLFVVTDPDERAPDKYVLSTFIDQRRIARRAVTLEQSNKIVALADQIRPLMYIGFEADPGIQAHVYALTADESESWKGAEGLEAVFLGTIVRASEFRVHPNSLYDEGVDHFAAILNGKLVEPIEQLMKRLA
jgi:hypothetical protein